MVKRFEIRTANSTYRVEEYRNMFGLYIGEERFSIVLAIDPEFIAQNVPEGSESMLINDANLLSMGLKQQKITRVGKINDMYHKRLLIRSTALIYFGKRLKLTSIVKEIIPQE